MLWDGLAKKLDLHDAATANDVDAARELIFDGADVNKKEDTLSLLHAATLENSVDVAKVNKPGYKIKKIDPESEPSIIKESVVTVYISPHSGGSD